MYFTLLRKNLWWIFFQTFSWTVVFSVDLVCKEELNLMLVKLVKVWWVWAIRHWFLFYHYLDLIQSELTFQNDCSSNYLIYITCKIRGKLVIFCQMEKTVTEMVTACLWMIKMSIFAWKLAKRCFFGFWIGFIIYLFSDTQTHKGIHYISEMTEGFQLVNVILH